ncbi:MAG: peptidase M50 [Limimaricola sp.]|uniref:HlyD family efflux transporter periplasmic adaptor subunit n=1 Tax=Limimaricola sp. TaxID=2211665 RepID=UPI001D53159C|nr:HlyD family efflux transporter periplasmic adaptor subunit [Limimaricola sp.]MBI1417660.1 peptidase M50 [Limimaricola sp.]
MSGSLRHQDWYLISEQKFRRRAAVTSTHQVFRGEHFLVISDRVTGQNLRLTQRAETIWKMLDGRRTAQQIWDALMRMTGPIPTQGELVEWIMTLVSAGLILSDHDLDPKHLSDRSLRRRNQMIEARLSGPLAIKVALFDPSRLIRALYPAFGWLFSGMGGLAIILLLAVALVLAFMNGEALRSGVDRTLLSQSGLIALALAYPAMKVMHELSHGFAVHRFGGEVREFGVMFLVFFPVPYVEASEASAFPDKYARMVVGGAGVVAELVMAALALFAWLQIEPGIERAILFNVMVIGSLSTLLFNGNPLLKFDSYFVLSDWLEMPNLANRSGAYLTDLFLGRLLGLRREVFPAPGEGKVLVIYGLLSLGYRLLLTVTITLIVSQLFFVVGIVLALWALIMGFVWPIVKMAKKGYKMAKAQNRSRRARWRLCSATVAVVGFAGFVPLPFSATGEGQIVSLPRAELRIGSSGQIAGDVVADATVVSAGTPLLSVDNPTQTARAATLRLNIADLEETLARGGLDVATRQADERELELARTSLADVEAREEARVLRAPMDGRVAWDQGRPPLQGSFVFRGDKLGQIVAPGGLEIIASFAAPYAGYLPDSGGRVQLRLPTGKVLEQSISRARVIDAGQQAPAPILKSAGGRVPEMPTAPGKALDAALVIWVNPDTDLSAFADARVAARIELPHATLAEQALFYLRRLFLRVNRV